MSDAAIQRALLLARDKVGPALASIPEGQWFERKSVRVDPRRLAETLVGFANADGGVLVVGLSEGRVEGVATLGRRHNALLQTSFDFTDPIVRAEHRLLPCVNDHGELDDLLVFDVAAGTTVHATTKDEVFLRVGDETRRLSFVQRRELFYDRQQAGYESERSTAPITALDEQLTTNYASRLGHPEPRRLLRARGLADGRVLTVAGCLLFAAEPQRWYPSAHLRVSRFDGSSRGTGSRLALRDDIRVEGPIPRALQEARRLVQSWQPRRRALGAGGRFEDIPLVPEDAWLEGIVNAVVHRSYSLAGDHIHINLYDDRIEIESPGRFPELVDLSDPLHVTRFARNPRIARVCADLRIGQELGEGIRRMFDEMRLADLVDPLYRQTSATVRLTLSGEPVHRALDARLPSETRAITQAIREAGALSTGDIAEVVGVSRPTVLRKLNELREAGLIEWVGKSRKDPRAVWRLLRQQSRDGA